MSRLRVLWALSSTDQLQAGFGRAWLELAGRLGTEHAIEFAVDDVDSQAIEWLRQFCDSRSLELYVGRGGRSPRSPEPANLDLPLLLAGSRWDIIMSCGWHGAANNGAIWAGAGSAMLLYAPHNPPASVRVLSPAQRGAVDAAHRAMLQRADAVLCDSPAQRARLLALAPDARVVEFPPAVDVGRYPAGNDDRDDSVLMVVERDCGPARFDLVAELIAAARRKLPTLRLITVSRCDQTQPVRELISIAEPLGAVGELELRWQYTHAAALLFPYADDPVGYAVLEALACGTPAVVAGGADLRSNHAHARAVTFVDLEDTAAAAARLVRTISMRIHVAALADRSALGEAHGFERRAQDLEALVLSSASL